MTPEEARQAMEATLYPGESIEAFGRAVETKKPTIQLPGDYVDASWVGFTRSRFIEVVDRSPADPSSTHLRDAARVELRRPLLGATKLYFDPVGAPGGLSLSVLQVDRDLAGAVRRLIADRANAPFLPEELTRYIEVTTQVDNPGLAAYMGADFVELRCERCNGLCGSRSTGGAVMPASSSVAERCAGCLRTVTGPVDAS